MKPAAPCLLCALGALSLVAAGFLLFSRVVDTGIPAPTASVRLVDTKLQQKQRNGLEAIHGGRPVWMSDLLRLTDRPSGPENDDELARLADSIPVGEIALAWPSLSAAALRSTFGIRLFDRWAALFPEEAARRAVERPESSVRKRLLESAVGAWAERDFTGTLAWCDSMAEGEAKNELRVVIGSQAKSAQPVIALRLAIELPDEHQARRSLAAAAAQSWALADPESAAAWGRTLAPDDLRDCLNGAIASAWASRDAAAALRFALSALPAGAAQEEAAAEIVRRAGSVAAGLSATVSDETLRATSLPVVVALWTARDAAGAGAWLAEVPRGLLRDQALEMFSRVLASSDASAAWCWAGLIDDSALKTISRERAANALR